MNVRDATEADLPAILERWSELHEAHQALNPELYALAAHAPGTWANFARARLRDPEAWLLVAEVDGEIEGYTLGTVGLRAPVYALREVGMVYDLAVRPSWRRRGVGEALTDALLARFRDAGLTHAQVNYSPTNPSAGAFWPSRGFEPLLVEAYKPLE